MRCIGLASSLAAGIAWADLGGRLPLALVWLWAACSLATGVGLARAWVRAPVRRSILESRAAGHGHGDRGRPAGGRTLRFASFVLSCGLAFAAGFDGLRAPLEAARRDARRVSLQRSVPVRVVDARVAERRTGVWGDEVRLIDVRAADAAGAVPSRLALRWGRSAATARAGDAVRARCCTPFSRAEDLLQPGARVRLGLRIAPLRGARNPGSADRARAEARRGFAGRARLVKPDWVVGLEPEAGASMLVRLADATRSGGATTRSRLATPLAGTGAGEGLVRALALGDRSGLDRETRDAFRALGLSHLLAVSGLHVGFVAGLAAGLWLRVAGLRGRAGRHAPITPFAGALCFACMTAALYAWLTGAAVAVLRASMLFGLFALGRLGLRVVAPGAALACVGLVILVVDPASLFDVGAQLSFAACAALVVAGVWRPAEGPEPQSAVVRLGKQASPLWDTVREMLRASLAVSLGLAPLLAFSGLALVPSSPLLNVLAIPFTGLVVLPASLLAIPLASVSSGALLAIVLWPAELLQTAAISVAGSIPAYANSALLTPGIVTVLAAVGLLALRLGAWRVAALFWLLIAVSGSVPGRSGAFDPSSPAVVFFDVGQGDAALVRGHSAALVIDTGPGPADGGGGMGLVRALQTSGLRRVDALAVTHGDLDHRGGARRVLESFPVGELWLPGQSRDDPSLQALEARARRLAVPTRWLVADASTRLLGDLAVSVLWPTRLTPGRSRNESSLVLRVGVGGSDFLFMADVGHEVEQALLAGGTDLTADVLKLAHHGSRRSTSEGFLRAVSPGIGVVSAPCEASRGLPSRIVLERLGKVGVRIGWTGRDGAGRIATDSSLGLQMTSWGERRDCRLGSESPRRIVQGDRPAPAPASGGQGRSERP